MAVSKGNHSTKKDRSTSDSLDFIDIVFTVTVTIGLTPELLGKPDVTGMLSEPWVKAALHGCPIVLAGDDWLHLSTFFLALLTLLLSWFGVHASLRKKPIRFDEEVGRFQTLCGMVRFILDVALVLIYGAIFVFFRQLHVVLSLISLVFLLYFLWDVLKTIEYWGKDSNESQINLVDWRAICAVIVKFDRQFVSLLFAVLLACLWWFQDVFAPIWAVVLAMVCTVMYRVSKIYFATWITWAKKTACAIGQ